MTTAPESPETLEHGSLASFLLMHPREGGIFSKPYEDRYQMHALMSWLSEKFAAWNENPSLHNLRKELDTIHIAHDGSYVIPEELQQRADSAARSWIESHGIEYSENEVEKALLTAESVIEYFTHNIFSEVIQIQPINEIASERNPLILLKHALTHADIHVRFEAARKLYIADMALEAEKIRSDSQPKIDSFYNLLDQHMFVNPRTEEQQPPTTLDNRHFLSYHEGPDNRCTYVRELLPTDKIDESMLGLNMTIHTLPMRTWYDNEGNKHHVLFEPRVKDAANFIIKELRNDTANALTLDDNLGAKLTFTSLEESELFFKTLQSRMGIAPMLGDVNYAFHRAGAGETAYRGVHAASSKKLEMVKYHARMNGTLYEFQINTVRTWIDQKLRDDVCWEDYMIKRIVQPDKKGGIPITQLLFPSEIYGIDLAEVADLIRKANQIYRRHLPIIIPPELRRKDRIIRMMTSSELRTSIDFLATQIVEKLTGTELLPGHPQDVVKKRKSDIGANLFIVIAEKDPARLESSALLLAKKLGLPRNKIVSFDEIKRIPKTARVILFDDILVQGMQLQKTHDALTKDHGLPEESLLTAVLVADQNVLNTVDTRAFFYSQTIDSTTTRIVFPFENEKRIFGRSSVFIATRQNGSTEILMEVLPDGKLKLPGGARENGESSRLTIQREAKEEINIDIPLKAIKRVSAAIRTTFEPHSDLTKTYYHYLLHDVFKVNGTLVPKDLPQGFQWVDIRFVVGNLRWRGQRELWKHLVEDHIIKIP